MKVLQKFGRKLGNIRIVAMAVGRRLTYEVQKRVGRYYYSEGPRYNSEQEAYEHALVVMAHELKKKQREKRRRSA
jgi:hypothetical protein